MDVMSLSSHDWSNGAVDLMAIQAGFEGAGKELVCIERCTKALDLGGQTDEYFCTSKP